MPEDLTKTGSPQSLTDLPGIGESKAKWLAEIGVESIDDLRAAPLEKVAHVRGVGFVLAQRLKELVGAPVEMAEPIEAADEQPESEPPAPPSEDELRWRAKLDETQSLVRDMVADLLAAPRDRALSPKFVKELRRLHDLVLGRPADGTPVSAKGRRRISRHTLAIHGLLDSAIKMDAGNKEHQKVLRKQLRARRGKLAKWV